MGASSIRRTPRDALVVQAAVLIGVRWAMSALASGLGPGGRSLLTLRRLWRNLPIRSIGDEPRATVPGLQPPASSL